MLTILDVGDHIAAIATAFVAVLAFGQYHWNRRQKRRRLERHLSEVMHVQFGAGDEGAQSVPGLMAALAMSEGEIMDAAFRSRLIVPSHLSDPQTGHATAVLLRHSRPPPRRL